MSLVMSSILVVELALSVSHSIAFEALVFAAGLVLFDDVLSLGLVGVVGVFGGLLVVDLDYGGVEFVF